MDQLPTGRSRRVPLEDLRDFGFADLRPESVAAQHELIARLDRLAEKVWPHNELAPEGPSEDVAAGMITQLLRTHQPHPSELGGLRVVDGELRKLTCPPLIGPTVANVSDVDVVAGQGERGERRLHRAVLWAALRHVVNPEVRRLNRVAKSRLAQAA